MTFEELLARDGRLVYRTKGVSMEPMLHQNRDLVMIGVPSAPLKKYDVALYRRGNDHVLHRVVGMRDGSYLIRGDNTYSLETVPAEDVIGVLTAFIRKGKQFSVEDADYRRYVRFWDSIYPLRALLFRCRRTAVGIARKLRILPLLRKLLRREKKEP